MKVITSVKWYEVFELRILKFGSANDHLWIQWLGPHMI